MSSDDGGLLSSLFRGALGMRESAVSGSGRRQWFFWGVGGIGMGREGTVSHGVRVVFHYVGPSNNPNFYII